MASIKGLDTNLAALYYAAQKTVVACTELFTNECGGRHGGYLTVRDQETLNIYFTLLIGEIPINKAKKYYRLSLEKGHRIFDRRQAGYMDLSSWQSRNEGEKKFGGAIIGQELILSFSGMPELCDEAIVSTIALHMRWMDQNSVLEIADISQNPFFVILNSRIQNEMS